MSFGAVGARLVLQQGVTTSYGGEVKGKRVLLAIHSVCPSRTLLPPPPPPSPSTVPSPFVAV